MNVYSLLIGINDYPIKPLAQCVNDAKKVEKYLMGLPKEVVVLPPKVLLNKAATKTAITAAITDHLGQAGDDDVALLYYSGHGAQEDAGGRFSDEHTGLIECIVSCPKEDQRTGYLLADKEIRYLFSQLPNNPHLVTIFDCCHSGEAVRSGGLRTKMEAQNKRLVQTFPVRAYNEFVFEEAISEADLKAKPLAAVIPFKSSVHIAACSAKELSWEDSRGGVFTRYLLQLLTSTNSQLSYSEVARWANISLKNVTNKKQSPTISVQGEGAVTAYSPWLNLPQADNSKLEQYIVYNEGKGWYLNRGSVLGIKSGAIVTVSQEDQKYDLKVEEVSVDSALIEDPLSAHGIELDRTQKIPVELSPTYSTLRVYVNDIDGVKGDQGLVENIINLNENIELGAADNADYFVNIFNEFVYISNYNDPFRPLVEQVSLLKGEETLKNVLQLQLKYLVKWNHFNTLVNTDNNFTVSPIKVEIKLLEEGAEWHDVSNGTYVLDAKSQRAPKEWDYSWAQVYQLKITNLTDEPLFVGVLELDSDLSISSKSWQKMGVELERRGKEGDTIFIFKDKNSVASSLISPYQEVYNWEHSFINYQFIVNNYEDLTPSITEYLQPGLETPIILSEEDPKQIKRSKKMVGGNIFDAFEKKWGTVKTTVKLRNPKHNLVSGALERNWKHYIEREEIAPFISKLYLQTEINGLTTESRSLPNRTGQEGGEKGLVTDVAVGLANYLDNQRRKRKFKRLRMLMPDKPVIVAEGDSWFLFPFLVKDILDYLMESFPVQSLAAAGDELGNYKKDGKLLEAVAETRPKYVLISGGGNDIIGPEIEHILEANIPVGQAATEYLNDKFDENLEKLKGLYRYFIEELKNHDSVEQLFLHGYDYIRVDHVEKFVAKGWVNRYMLERGMNDADDRERVIRHLIDSFNGILADLAKDDSFVTYLDLRGQVGEGQWHDEIHPNDEGYGILSKVFVEAINKFQLKRNQP